jgi:hypothetical protein
MGFMLLSAGYVCKEEDKKIRLFQEQTGLPK